MATNGVTVPVNGVDHGATATLQSFLSAHPSVRFIRYDTSDHCAISRVRFTTTTRALQIAADPNGGVATGSPITSAGLQSGGIIMELFQAGDDIWIPDWTSIREFAVSPGTAIVQCEVEEHAEEAGGKEAMFARCPRSVLRRVVEDAKAKHNVDFLVGFEIEFYLVASPGDSQTIDSPSGTWTPASVRASNWRNIVEESVTLLESAGVHVWSFCQEGGNSKYEISLSPLRPVESVDALHFAKETIKSVAQKNGCHATMHAKAFETGPTAGAHIHMSLSRPEFGTPFLAGMLKHFRPLCGLMHSNVESYQRTSQFGMGAITWGWQHKLVCVKRIQDAYFELRPPDAFSNMYLLLAGIFGVGLKGVEDDEELTSKSMTDTCAEEPPTAEQRKKFNITQDLPKDLEESIKEFKADAVLKEVLGEKCFDRYVLNKEKELAACKKMNSAERRKVLIEHF